MENNENQKYVEIGKRIKEARDQEGLTQSELGSRLGYKSPTFMSLIEDGKRKVRIDDLEKIAEMLHRDLNYFLQGEMTSAPTVKMALRSDKSLNQDDIKTIESVIEALMRGKDTKDGRDRRSTK